MSLSAFGVLIDGVEADVELTLDMGLTWETVVGGPPVAQPYLPSDGSLDSLVGTISVKLSTASDASLEGAAPPHGDGPNTLILPVIQDELAIPGIVGTVANGFATIANVLVDNNGSDGFAPSGREGVGVDLFGNKISVIIPCDQTNETFSAVVPSIVAHHYGTHEIEPNSHQLTGSVTSGSVRSRAQGLSRQLGNARKATISCTLLTITEADSIVRWARAVRASSVVVPPYAFGPGYVGETVSAVIKSLKLKQTGARTWSADIELYLDSSTATKPTIWSISPAYVASGAAANVVVRGSGFDAATVFTVGGVAATVTSWTSGTLYVTVPAGVAGQYEVVATNAQGSSTGTLWRYDAGEITFGTGGDITGTVAVDVDAKNFVGFTASGDIVKADAVLGIVAAGYTAVTVPKGGAIKILQDGYNGPFSGLTAGQQVFLGQAGLPASAPPDGAVFSQQIGIATETGIAVNCGDGATYL